MTQQPCIYVLFHETNTGKYDDSDGYIEAIYSTEAEAEKAKLAAVRTAIRDGKAVYWNPDTEEEEPTGYWTDDWRVECHQILTKAPKLPRKLRKAAA